jgi:acyl-CoA synthetase (AMP-forming)/AMP-acid ligase II
MTYASTVPTSLCYPELQTLSATIAFHAARAPHSAAILIDGRTVTYGMLHRSSNRTAHALVAAGVEPGTRVAYLGKESEHYYDLMFACAKTGAVLVPINWRLTADEVQHILRDSGTHLLFVEAEFAPVADGIRAELPALSATVDIDGPDGLGTGYSRWAAEHPDDDPAPVTGPGDPVAQLYTSGTTGLPKGVVLAQRSFFAVRDAMHSQGLTWIDWQQGDVSLMGIPGFHIGGVWWSTQGFNAGITLVIMRMWSAQDAVRLIRDHGVTTACMVPAMLAMVLAEHGVTSAEFATLRKVVYGGSPISEPLLQRCIDEIGCEFAQIYGLTETGNTAVCLPPDQHVVGGGRLLAAGRPYPGIELKVIDADGNPLPPGELGEVCIRTPAAMVEYWQQPRATATTLIDGWIHTGDAGTLDDEGYVFIRDRIKDLIIVAGENIYPAEIEQVLVKHPAIAEVAVVGVPHEDWGEAVHACVVLRPEAEATRRELFLFLRGKIAEFKIPISYTFLPVLPRNPSGKVLRRVLRDQYWQDRERQVN